ncbi:Trypsin domain containing protein, partial [Asbolus verrucosus]
RSTERFLCSGTILNRRWILTKAKPIAYLRVADYWFIVEGQFALPVDDSSLTKYDVSWVLHDNYIEEENVAQNLALARSALEITFEVTSVILGAPDGHSFTNCRLVLWNWESDDSQSGVVTKTKIPVRFPVRHLCRGAHSGPERHFSCIQRDLRRPPYEFFKPCAINLGAPIVCDLHLLWGVFLGNMEESQCKGDKFQGETKENDKIQILLNHTSSTYLQQEKH